MLKFDAHVSLGVETRHLCRVFVFINAQHNLPPILTICALLMSLRSYIIFCFQEEAFFMFQEFLCKNTERQRKGNAT